MLLGGVDVFHLMNDREMRRRGLSGNQCMWVVEVDGRLDMRGLERRLSMAMVIVPELTWQLSARIPGTARWVLGSNAAPPLAQHDGDPRALVEVLLDTPIGGNRPWALDVLRGPDHDALVFRWYHPLCDAKAGERLLTWLGSGEHGPEAPPPPNERAGSSDRLVASLPRPEKIALARAYAAHVTELGRVPSCSPADAGAPPSRGGVQRSVRTTLDEERTRAFDQRVRREARLSETSLMTLAATRAVDELLRERGFAPPQYLVPVPLSFDPKGERARMFGNVLTMMLLQLDRADLADTARSVAHIAEQQREIVRKKLDLGMLAGLELARWLPRPAYRWLLGRPFTGPANSLVISNPGTVALERFAGLRVLDAYPLASVISPPAFQVIFSRHRGRLSAQLVYVEPTVSREEAMRASEHLSRDLATA